MDRRPLIVGEAPARTTPPGSLPLSGRPAVVLCQAAGIDPGPTGDCRDALARRYDLANLLGSWPGPSGVGAALPAAEARDAADRLDLTDRVVVLLGRRVAAAVGVQQLAFFDWRTRDLPVPARALVVVPHPSGLNRHLNDPRVRDALGRALRRARSLARPSEPALSTPLSAEARDVLARLAVLSAGTTTAWSPSGAGGDLGSRTPPGDGDHPYDRHVAALLAAPDEEARARALARAREELEHQLRRDPEAAAGVEESETERAHRFARETLGVPAEECGWVAGWLGTTARQARAMRRLADAHPDTGERVASEPVAGWEEEARRLLDAGWSVRGIEMKVGVSKSTIQRLRRAA